MIILLFWESFFVYFITFKSCFYLKKSSPLPPSQLWGVCAEEANAWVTYSLVKLRLTSQLGAGRAPPHFFPICYSIKRHFTPNYNQNYIIFILQGFFGGRLGGGDHLPPKSFHHLPLPLPYPIYPPVHAKYFSSNIFVNLTMYVEPCWFSVPQLKFAIYW